MESLSNRAPVTELVPLSVPDCRAFWPSSLSTKTRLPSWNRMAYRPLSETSSSFGPRVSPTLMVLLPVAASSLTSLVDGASNSGSTAP